MRQSERTQEVSKEAEGRPKCALKQWKEDRDTKMNRQNIKESLQILRTERSISSVSEGRVIVLFDSCTLQRDNKIWGAILQF